MVRVTQTLTIITIAVVSTLSDSDIGAYICVCMQAWCSVTSISSDAIYVCDAVVVVIVIVVLVVALVTIMFLFFFFVCL